MKISVAIPTYGRDTVLIESLENILPQIEPGMELLVIDQNPELPAPVERRLRELHDAGSIRWFRSDKPSLTAARNRALSESKAPIVLFLDDDVVISDEMIRQHLAHHERGVAPVVSGRIYQWRHEPILPSWDDPRARDNPHPLPTGYPEGHVGPIDWFMGGHHSIRKEVAMAAGGYDESFVGPAFGEDTDMARRLIRAGHSIFHDSTIEMLHRRYPAGGCRIPGNRSWANWTKSANHFLYMFRHGEGLAGKWRYFVWGLRSGPLLKENAVRPWRWSAVWWAVLQAMRYGWRNRAAVQSSFVRSEPSG